MICDAREILTGTLSDGSESYEGGGPTSTSPFSSERNFSTSSISFEVTSSTLFGLGFSP